MNMIKLFPFLISASALFGSKKRAAAQERLDNLQHQEDMALLFQQFEADRLANQSERESNMSEWLGAFVDDMNSVGMQFLADNELLLEQMREAEADVGRYQADGEYWDIKNRLESETILMANAADIEQAQSELRASMLEETNRIRKEYWEEMKEMDETTQNYILQNTKAANDQIQAQTSFAMEQLLLQQEEFESRTTGLLTYMSQRRDEYRANGDAMVDAHYQEGLAKFEAALGIYMEQKQELQLLWQEEMDEQKEFALWYSEALRERELYMHELNEKRRQSMKSYMMTNMKNQQEMAEASNSSNQAAVDRMMDYQNNRLGASNELELRQMEIEAELEMMRMAQVKQAASLDVAEKFAETSLGETMLRNTIEKQLQAGVLANQGVCQYHTALMSILLLFLI